MAKYLVFSLLLLLAIQSTRAEGFTGLVYWSATDCQPCAEWSDSGRRDDFLEHFKSFVSVEKHQVKDPASSFTWDAAPGLQQTLEQQLSSPKKLPAFDFVCQGKRSQRLQGLMEWDSFWWENTKKLLNQCQSMSAGS